MSLSATSSEASHLRDILEGLALFGIPILLLAREDIPKWPRTFSSKFLFSIFLVWMILLALEILYVILLFREARTNDISIPDPGNRGAAFLLFGWLVAAMTSIPALIIRRAIQWHTKKYGSPSAKNNERPKKKDPNYPY